MATTINADTSSGLILTSDTSGIVQIQNAGTTKLTVNSSGATVAGTLAATAVTGDGSALTGLTSGLSNVAMFYKNSIVEYTGENQTVTGWTAYNNVGTAPTESSGVFTFPSTGYWLVRLQANLIDDTDTSGNGLVKASIFQGTSEISNGAAHLNESPYNHQVTLVPQVLLNITDVAAAAQKITIKVSSHSGSTVVGLKGGSGTPYSNILFQKVN
jgi:hypothetical protein